MRERERENYILFTKYLLLILRAATLKMHPLRGVVAGGNRREIFAGVMTLILLAFTQARGPSDITLPLCSSTDPLQFLPLEVKEPAAIDPFPSDWEISTRSWMPSSLEGRVTRSLDFFDLLTVPKLSPPLREWVQPMSYIIPPVYGPLLGLHILHGMGRAGVQWGYDRWSLGGMWKW